MGVGPDAIETTVLQLLGGRRDGATICPSEAARALADDWRPLMDDVREVVFRLADAGVVEVTQRGEVVDGRSARGPIRVRSASR